MADPEQPILRGDAPLDLRRVDRAGFDQLQHLLRPVGNEAEFDRGDRRPGGRRFGLSCRSIGNRKSIKSLQTEPFEAGRFIRRQVGETVRTIEPAPPRSPALARGIAADVAKIHRAAKIEATLSHRLHRKSLASKLASRFRFRQSALSPGLPAALCHIPYMSP